MILCDCTYGTGKYFCQIILVTNLLVNWVRWLQWFDLSDRYFPLKDSETEHYQKHPIKTGINTEKIQILQTKTCRLLMYDH